MFSSPNWDVDAKSNKLTKQLFGKVKHAPNGQNAPSKKQILFNSKSKSINKLENISNNETVVKTKPKLLKKLKKKHMKVKQGELTKQLKEFEHTYEGASTHQINATKSNKPSKINKLRDALALSSTFKLTTPNFVQSSTTNNSKKIYSKQKDKNNSVKINKSKKLGLYKMETPISGSDGILNARPNKQVIPKKLVSNPKKPKKIDRQDNAIDKKNKMSDRPKSNLSNLKLSKLFNNKVSSDGIYKQSLNIRNELNQPFARVNQVNNPASTLLAGGSKRWRHRFDGSLRERMMRQLQGSRFRYLNEQLYSSDGKEAQLFFKTDPEAFEAYHQGYQQQVARWPLNPLHKIINNLKKKSEDLIVADFGCGDACLARSIPQVVHSFDLVALSDEVTACNMANTPLPNESVDVVVFCLSLMGTNLQDYLVEANRVLKQGGLLKIAEVESRIESIDDFIKKLEYFGFTNTFKDLSHDLFYFVDFKKQKAPAKKNKRPYITLKPCLYKKR